MFLCLCGLNLKSYEYPLSINPDVAIYAFKRQLLPVVDWKLMGGVASDVSSPVK